MYFRWVLSEHVYIIPFNASLNPNFARIRDARIFTASGRKKNCKNFLCKKHSLSQKANDAWREAVFLFPLRVNTATMSVFVCKQECKANLEKVYQWPSWALCVLYSWHFQLLLPSWTFNFATWSVCVSTPALKCLQIGVCRERYFLANQETFEPLSKP